MALTYRNVLKGHVVSVPEPADILAAAEVEAERLARQGTKPARTAAERLMTKAQQRARQTRQTLAKMDDSRRWERYVAPPVAAAPAPVEPAPLATEPLATEPDLQPAPKPARAPAKAAKPAESPVES